jgi:plastocyanin
MTVRRRGVVLACGLLLAVPGVAQAKAKTRAVSMGTPIKAQPAFQQSGLDVNDFFPHAVKIHVGDTVKFAPAGFHTVDIPAKGGQPLPLFSPNGQKVAGAADANGAPFWFNGQDALGFTPDLLNGTFGKKLTYNGKKRVESGVPLTENPKPLKVKFKKAGTYRYYCDVHTGMTGVVSVVKKDAKVPSGKQLDKLVKAQVARDLTRGRALAQTRPPAGTVYTGASARGGVEFFGMLPSSITVPAGTTLLFSMSPLSYEVHTATFGPGDPDKEPSSYLGQIAASFEGATPDPRGIYPSQPPGTTGVLTPLLHGNGFWNSGVLDASSATPLPPSNALTFGSAGTYQFYCVIHPFMHGTVIVT